MNRITKDTGSFIVKNNGLYICDPSYDYYSLKGIIIKNALPGKYKAIEYFSNLSYKNKTIGSQFVCIHENYTKLYPSTLYGRKVRCDSYELGVFDHAYYEKNGYNVGLFGGCNIYNIMENIPYKKGYTTKIIENSGCVAYSNYGEGTLNIYTANADNKIVGVRIDFSELY